MLLTAAARSRPAAARGDSSEYKSRTWFQGGKNVLSYYPDVRISRFIKGDFNRLKHADGRPAGVGQVDAGGTPPRYPAASGTRRGARARHDPVGRGRAAQRRGVAARPVSRPAPV